MGTRAFISTVNKDGTITGIYNHWDGYPSCLGKILNNAYETKERVDELLSFGDVSSMDENLDHCSFYSRDKGESFEDVQALTYKNMKEAVGDSSYVYAYLFRSDLDVPRWECMDVYDNSVKPLQEVLDTLEDE